MHTHLEVALADDGPVVVKVATGPAVQQLRHERDRLARAVHPGVVALAGCAGLDDGGTGVGVGDGQSDGSGNVAELRTFHAGEPVSRWHGAVTDIAGVGAAVASTLADLHAIGVVHGRIDDSHILIGADGRPRLCGWSGPDGAPAGDDVAALGRVIGDLLARSADQDAGGAWPRPWRRRPGAALGALYRVVERATDPVATRRPSARALADAVVTAVPQAALPAGSHLLTGTVEEAPLRALEYADQPDTFDRIWAFGDTRSDDERWAAAFGPGPADIPLATITTPGWSSASRPRDDDRTRDHRAVGARVSPTPPTTPPPGVAPRWRGRVLGLCFATLVVAGVGGAAVIVRPGGDADASRSDLADAADQPSGPDTTTIATGQACPDVTPPAADVDDDGCREALVVDGSTVDAGVARWSLGEPGDVAAVGDWDCDGHASAALLRPSTGDVFVFERWADADEPVTVASSERVAGGKDVRAERAADGCDRLIVDLGGGRTTAVEVPL
jgi:hypothetical protein